MKKELGLSIIGFISLVGLILYLPNMVIARDESKDPIKEVKSEEIIRLHVIANSDEETDQELKLKVRDEIIALIQPNLLEAKDRAGAERILTKNLAEIETVAKKKIQAEGYAYPVKAVIGDFNFPVKAYSDFIAPAGNYRALKVIIGEGAGANWWCVMFPPICFVDLKHQVNANGSAAIVKPSNINTSNINNPETNNESTEEVPSIEQEVEIEVRFKIVELWQSFTTKINSLF